MSSRIKIFIYLLIYLFIFYPNISRAVTLYAGAANQVVYEGQSFVMDWYLDSQDDAINTVDLKLKFNPDQLQVLSTSTGSSAINVWVKPPEYSNEKGTIEVVGGMAGGIKSDKIKLLSVTFNPIKTGSTQISMDENSKVLLSDGMGDPAKLVFSQIGFPINSADARPVNIHSDTNPDQATWYRSDKVIIKFDAKPDEAYSYSFSSNTEISPDDKPDEIRPEYVFENLNDGVYYFKLNSKKGTQAWQEAGVYRAQIDRTPPQAFRPALSSDPGISGGRPFVSFSAMDKESGISYYEVRFGKLGHWVKTSDTTLFLPGVILGDSIEIKAVDGAGNYSIQKVSTKYQTGFNKWLILAIIIIAIGMLFAAFKWYKHLLHKYRM